MIENKNYQDHQITSLCYNIITSNIKDDKMIIYLLIKLQNVDADNLKLFSKK